MYFACAEICLMIGTHFCLVIAYVRLIQLKGTPNLSEQSQTFKFKPSIA